MADDTATSPVPTPPADPPASPTPAPAAVPDADAELGEAGKRALDAERTQRRAADKAARDAATRAEAAEARLAELDELNKSDTEKAIEKAVKDADAAARADVTAAYERRLLEADVRTAAAGKIADPADAIRLIDIEALERDADGLVNPKTIEAAIADLVKSKPYLVGATPPGPGSADQGARSANGVTLAQLKAMTPAQVAALDPKIVEAAMAAGH